MNYLRVWVKVQVFHKQFCGKKKQSVSVKNEIKVKKMYLLLYVKQIENYKGEGGEGAGTTTRQYYSSTLLSTC